MKNLFSGIKCQVSSSKCFMLHAFLFAFVSFLSPTSAQTFDFLRQESSARQLALNGTAANEDVSAFWLNPANAKEGFTGFFPAHKVPRLAEMSFTNHLAGIKQYTLGYKQNVAIRNIGATITGGLRYVNYGDIPQTNQDGEAIGTFTPAQMALSVGIARSALFKKARCQKVENSQNPTEQVDILLLERPATSCEGKLDYGVNVHYALSNAATFKASALTADFGVAYEMPKLRMRLNAALLNTGKVLDNFGETDDQLPTDLRIGISHRLDKMPLTLHVTGYDLNNISTADTTVTFSDNFLKHTNFGGEFRLGPNLRLRVGYNHRKHEALKTKATLDLAGVGFGVGIKVSKFKIDWGTNNWSQNGKIHQLTISSNF